MEPRSQKTKEKNKEWEASIGWHHIRSATSNSIFQSSRRILANSATQTEAYALLQAIQSAVEFSGHIVLKTYCLVSIHFLLNPK